MQEAKKIVIQLGRKIRHSKHGTGTIISVSKDGNKQPVRIYARFGEFVYDFMYSDPSIEFLDESTLKVQQVQKIRHPLFDEIDAARRPSWTYCLSNGNILKEKKLIVGKCYGTKAQDIFLACCDVFGWNRAEAWKFGPQKKLYAERAAHGLSPWFLTHHCWIDPKERKLRSNWWNTITEKKIFEEWGRTDDCFYHDFSKRITFAKTPGGYVYIGVFQPRRELLEEIDVRSGRMRYVKRYDFVQSDYEG